MLKAIIIDDEEGARITLETIIRQFLPDVDIVAQCANVPDGVLAINKHNPDVVLLDIEMPGYNGFELLDFFKEIHFEIIFVTAYSEYAIKAFEVSAVDYLLKPVEIESLKNAFQKAALKCSQSNIMHRLELMKDTYKTQEVHKIALPMNDGLLFVDVNEIILFEADRAYTQVFLRNGSKITVSKAMRVFEDMLINHPAIFRPHRSFLINTQFLKKYIRGDSTIILDNNMNIPLSREKKSDFENMLKKNGMANV